MINTEELLAYLYLLREGILNDTAPYEKRLDELFLEFPGDKNLLELEMLGGDVNRNFSYIADNIDFSDLDTDKFGSTMMKLLRPIYYSMDIWDFGGKMVDLGESLFLPCDCEPFSLMFFADCNIRDWDDEKGRIVFEKMLSYYERKSV